MRSIFPQRSFARTERSRPVRRREGGRTVRRVPSEAASRECRLRRWRRRAPERTAQPAREKRRSGPASARARGRSDFEFRRDSELRVRTRNHLLGDTTADGPRGVVHPQRPARGDRRPPATISPAAPSAAA